MAKGYRRVNKRTRLGVNPWAQIVGQLCRKYKCGPKDIYLNPTHKQEAMQRYNAFRTANPGYKTQDEIINGYYAQMNRNSYPRSSGFDEKSNRGYGRGYGYGLMY